ncbi:hypothetical protein D7V91_14655 [bacterium 1xD42-67]|nr:hypothetical protein D7V91_14655 [bacterium 1xD42-67]
MANIITLILSALNGGLDWVILIGKTPVYPYENRKRTSDIPEKYRYKVVLPGNNYTELNVSVPGSVDALAAVTDEQISEGCANLRPLLVRFTDCTVKVYSKDNEQKLTGTASGVELVKLSK